MTGGSSDGTRLSEPVQAGRFGHRRRFWKIPATAARLAERVPDGAPRLPGGATLKDALGLLLAGEAERIGLAEDGSVTLASLRIAAARHAS